MVVEKNDWRLMGQEKFLRGVTLYWKKYIQYGEHWDHDHCEFCMVTFMVEDYPDVLHEGWATEDNYRWICNNCFDDFREMFEFKTGCLEGGDNAT